MTKKMLVTFDPAKPEARSSDFLLPVVERDLGLVLFGVKSKKVIPLGMVIFTGKELTAHDLFARLIDSGRIVLSVNDVMKDIADYLAELKNQRIGDVVIVERQGERLVLHKTEFSAFSPSPKRLP